MNRQGRHPNADTAENFAAAQYDLTLTPEADWHDAIADNGTKYEVKGAEKEKRSGRQGRFRIWEDNHHSLSVSNGQANAWYVFVVIENGTVLDHRRTQPQTITRIINDRGGWNRSGHSRGGRQHKLPISELF